MNRLTKEKRVQIVEALAEGCGIRATCRMTGVSKNTVVKLLVDLGEVCAEYQAEALVDLPCKRIQVDEIWSFCHSKQENVPEAKQGVFAYGDVWTFTGLCADTKLVPTWLVGSRDAGCACEVMRDLAARLGSRVQMTTDGHKMYLSAVEDAFGSEVDYAMLVKHYGSDPEEEKRYSPAECLGCSKAEIQGSPDPAHIWTSYVERRNLTMRMSMRRFTRLTNAFSKKVEHLAHAVALHFMHCNFARIHRRLRMTPAMGAGVSDHVWTLEEIAGLLEAKEQAEIDAGAMKRGPYKKRAV